MTMSLLPAVMFPLILIMLTTEIINLQNYPNVSGVVPFITGLGCGMEMTGPFMDLLRRTIMGYVQNPNIGAAIVCALDKLVKNGGTAILSETTENNKGGLANVLEKSLGGAKKGGETALNEVYDYAEKVTEL